MLKDSLGLEKFGNLSALLDNAGKKERSAALEMELDRLREDPANPRSRYDEQAIQELAASIKARGVIAPVSVRNDPENPGKFIINHGHRRVRASRLAGKQTIPAVINDDFSDEDQIIENIQRENLDMRDIADYIGRKVNQGLTQREIADKIGKSAAYVNQHAKLLNLSDNLQEAVQTGKVKDITAINELTKLEKQRPAAVVEHLQQDVEISRADARALKEKIYSRKSRARERNEKPAEPVEKPQKINSRTDADSIKVSVVVLHLKGPARIILTRRPQNLDHVWVRFDNALLGEEEVPVNRIKLLAIEKNVDVC